MAETLLLWLHVFLYNVKSVYFTYLCNTTVCCELYVKCVHARMYAHTRYLILCVCVLMRIHKHDDIKF